jgi:hypothetical protein
MVGWGLRPHAGVKPLHPVLTRLRSAIAKYVRCELFGESYTPLHEINYCVNPALALP